MKNIKVTHSQALDRFFEIVFLGCLLFAILTLPGMNLLDPCNCKDDAKASIPWPQEQKSMQ